MILKAILIKFSHFCIHSALNLENSRLPLEPFGFSPISFATLYVYSCCKAWRISLEPDSVVTGTWGHLDRAFVGRELELDPTGVCSSYRVTVFDDRWPFAGEQN